MNRKQRKQSHTPGPWENHHGEVFSKDGIGICVPYGLTENNTIANAQLISAAPELLDAAIQAISIPLIFLDQIRDVELRHKVADAYNELALAINKAEGRI